MASSSETLYSWYGTLLVPGISIDLVLPTGHCRQNKDLSFSELIVFLFQFKRGTGCFVYIPNILFEGELIPYLHVKYLDSSLLGLESEPAEFTLREFPDKTEFRVNTHDNQHLVATFRPSTQNISSKLPAWNYYSKIFKGIFFHSNTDWSFQPIEIDLHVSSNFFRLNSLYPSFYSLPPGFHPQGSVAAISIIEIPFEHPNEIYTETQLSSKLLRQQLPPVFSSLKTSSIQKPEKHVTFNKHRTTFLFRKS